MRKEAEELLRIVGLEDLRDEMATSLPYGKQRRLEIARALATEPKLLLLDEPAAGMNPQETDDLTAFIAKIRDEFGLTIFMIEHHRILVMEISDRTMFLILVNLLQRVCLNEIRIIRELLMHILEVPQMSNILEVKDLSVSYGGIKA